MPEITEQRAPPVLFAVLKKTLLFFGKALPRIGKAAIRLGKKSLPLLKIMAPPIVLGLALFVLLFWFGLGDMIGEDLVVIIGPVPALLVIFFICFIPSISPLLGPALLIAIAAGVLCAEQIAAGKAPLILALTALFSIDAQLGGSFIPSGLAMGENEPETISAGVPGVVFTRLITVPLAVALAGLFWFLIKK